MSTTKSIQEISGGGINLKSILITVLRRKFTILAIALPIIIIAFIATLQSTSSYHASSQVMVQTQMPENPSFVQQRVNIDVVMSSASLVATSIPVAELAAKSIVDSIAVLAESDPSFAPYNTVADITELLLFHVSSGQIADSEILEIGYSHANPRFAMIAVTALTRSLITYNVTSRQNPLAVSYYTDQINRVQADMDSLLILREHTMEAAGLRLFMDDAKGTANQVANLEYEFDKAQSERVGAERNLSFLKQTIENDPDFIPTSPNSSSSLLISLKHELLALNNQLEELQLSYTDDSRLVKDKQLLIDATTTRLMKARSDYLTGLEARVEMLRFEEDVFESALTERRLDLLNYPSFRRELDIINIATKSRQDLLERLQSKRGEVQLKVGMDDRINDILMLNPPSISGFTGSGKKFLYLILASVFGVSLGLIIAIFLDNEDHRIHSRQEALTYLRIPVLGTITKKKG